MRVCFAATLLSLPLLAAVSPYAVSPLSQPANPMFLKGMGEKPWWNDAWRQRLPIVVSESSTNEVAAYVADFELDLGRPGMADSVRVVTDYGVEIPCWTAPIRRGGTAETLRLQFKTPLHAAENRCFHVYFDNPKAEKCRPVAEVTGVANGRFLTLRNTFLTLDFLRETTTRDVLRRFKINGSPADNEISVLGARLADNALAPALSNGRGFFTNTIAIVEATPFKQKLLMSNDVFTAAYTLYADAERLDYAFAANTPGKPVIQSIGTSWASGGDVAWDDLVYPTLIGTINTDRAQLDYRRDFGEPIRHPDLGNWSGEGWFAFYDRKKASYVGQFYSPADVSHGVSQSEWSGSANAHAVTISLRGTWGKDPQGTVRGAAFGLRGRADLVQNAYRVWANPPKVLVGKAEPWRKVEARVPDMSRDFCSFLHVSGDNRNLMGRHPELVRESSETLVEYLRRDGFNGCHLGDGNWAAWNPSKAQVDEFVSAATNKTYGGNGKTDVSWRKSVGTTKDMRILVDTLHAHGLGIYHWGNSLFGADALFDQPRARALDIAIMGVNNAKFGYDGTWCGAQGREGPTMRAADGARIGGDYWKYRVVKDRERFLHLQDLRIAHAHEFAEAVRKAGGKSVCWGCDLAHLCNDQFSLDNAGDFDVVIEELMIAQLLDRNERNRFGIARMRAMHDNEPRTVWNHFWSRIAGDDVRVGNCELPFIYGVNGFNQESADYRQIDTEIVTKGSEFYHFAYNTGMAAQSPKFIPVRHYLVFRDSLDHRADILAGRVGRQFLRARDWSETSETDGAASIWTTATGIHADLVVNRFFALKSLKRYPMLVLPHNYKLSEAFFAIVKAYVEEGGVCYAEGAQFPFAKFFTDGATAVANSKWGFVKKAYGKGKLLYSPKNPSLVRDSLEPGQEFRAFVDAESGVVSPIAVEQRYAKHVDGMVRTDGRNFMFGSFALNMPGNTGAVVKVKLNLKPQPLFAVDMKSGRRVSFDGTLAFVQRPRETTMWLVGDTDFTSVPAYARAPQGDFGANRPPSMHDGARANVAAREKLGDFSRPLAVLLVQDGASAPNPTVARHAVEQVLFDRSAYSQAAFAKALAGVKVLHFMGVKEDFVEKVFSESSAEIAAFLKRGGSLLLDRSRTGPAARKFLREAGVYDVNESLVTGSFDGVSNKKGVGEKHAIFTVPMAIEQPWWVGNHKHSGVCFATWDRERQFAPFLVFERDKPDKSKDYAMCVCQEKVLGEGKVIFQENERIFTTWYENPAYGENLFSYALGMSLHEHKRKVQLLFGGFGHPVEFPKLIRNGF